MNKPKLLYASPFPPQKSGISDYSQTLVYGLKEYFDVTLLIDNDKLEQQELYRDFNVKIYGKDKINFEAFEYKIYNIGNNPYYHSYIYDCAIKHPGTIILHDFILYYLVVGYYQDKKKVYSKIYELEGAKGIHLIKKALKTNKKDFLEYKELAHLFPLNKEIANSNNLIIVHSQCNYNKLRKINEHADVKKINHISLIRENEPIMDRKTLFKKYNIPSDSCIIASFGFIASTKLNSVICRVVAKLNQAIEKKVVYLMVGEGTYADSLLGENIKKTGLVNINEFNSYISHSDLIINLRYPSMGETSGALIRALAMGKLCVVSNDAWFSELPDDVVIKLKNANIKDELRETISNFLNAPEKFKQLGKNAKAYIEKEHNLQHISKQIAEFIL